MAAILPVEDILEQVDTLAVEATQELGATLVQIPSLFLPILLRGLIQTHTLFLEIQRL